MAKHINESIRRGQIYNTSNNVTMKYNIKQRVLKMDLSPQKKQITNKQHKKINKKRQRTKTNDKQRQ